MTICTATFETGVSGNTLSTSDTASAMAFDSVTGTPTYQSSPAYDKLSMLVNTIGHFITYSTSLGTLTDHYGRIYIYITSYSAGTARLVMDDTNNFNILRMDGAGIVSMRDAAGQDIALINAVPLNQWVRIEYHVIHSATVGQHEIKLFLNADATTPTEVVTGAANRNTGANISAISVGMGSGSSAIPVYFDNVVVGATNYSGPANKHRLIDTFSRSVTDDWGMSDSGHVWKNTSTLTNIDVNGSRGTMNISTGSAQATTDLEFFYFNALFKFTHDTEAIGNLNRVQFNFRNTQYSIVLENNSGSPNADLRVSILLNVGPTSLSNANFVQPLGEQWYCRTIVSPGGLITCALWKVGDPEPAPQMSTVIPDSRLGTFASPDNGAYISFSAFRASSNDMSATIDDIDIIDLSTSAAYAPRSGSSMVRG